MRLISGGRFCAMALLFATLATPALALECPAPESGAVAGSIRESQATIDRLAALLATGDVANRVPELVADLRARHPTAGGAAIANYLISAYCPVVNRMTGLGEAEKQQRLSSFSSTALAFAGP
jgi:hypothetical protein